MGAQDGGGAVAEFLAFLAHDNDAAAHQLRDHCVETGVRGGLACGNAIGVCGHVLRHTNVQDHGTFWRADQAHQLFGRYFGEAGFGVVSHQGILSERSVGCEPALRKLAGGGGVTTCVGGPIA